MRTSEDPGARVRPVRGRGGALSTGPTLVLEGALETGGAAVVVAGQVASLQLFERRRGGRGGLLAAARAALDEGGSSLGEVRALAVGTGPGSFTGVRVALGFAEGLLAGLGRRLPVAGAGSVALLAASVTLDGPALVAIGWGRTRVLLAPVDERGLAEPGAKLVPVVRLTSTRGLEGRTIVTHPSAAGLDWPAGVRMLPVERSGVEILAALAARGDLPETGRAGLKPAYAVAPDAVLPTRSARFAAGYRSVRLRAGEVAELEELERRCHEQPWSAAILAEELRDAPDRFVLGVRRSDGRLVAAAVARFGVDEVALLRLACAESDRRRGLARALVREVADEGRRRGLERVDTDVHAANSAATALYESEGFVVVGRRRRYYRDGGDALLMSAVLKRTER
jgi:ribosomal-protein-alanine N-acetyltransferase